jgi:hypothetical protein
MYDILTTPFGELVHSVFATTPFLTIWMVMGFVSCPAFVNVPLISEDGIVTGIERAPTPLTGVMDPPDEYEPVQDPA